MSLKVERVLQSIKGLTAAEMVELSRRLGADRDWPPKAGSPVGAKPNPPLRILRGRAARRRE